MTAEIPPSVPSDRTLAHLRELIEALDRRVPQIESAGESEIAREAAAVRDKALERIRELEAAQAARASTAKEPR
jgi:transcriptional regulator of aromatic amino acid metabolism